MRGAIPGYLCDRASDQCPFVGRYRCRRAPRPLIYRSRCFRRDRFDDPARRRGASGRGASVDGGHIRPRHRAGRDGCGRPGRAAGRRARDRMCRRSRDVDLGIGGRFSSGSLDVFAPRGGRTFRAGCHCAHRRRSDRDRSDADHAWRRRARAGGARRIERRPTTTAPDHSTRKSRATLQRTG